MKNNIINALLDNKMSSKAFKLYCLICEEYPDPEFYSMDNLRVCFKEGRDAIRLAIRELISLGYVEKHQTKDFTKMSYNHYKVLK
jgi:hypothetical protein